MCVPEVPAYIDSLLADTDLKAGFYPKLGNKHMQVIGVTGFPGSTHPGLLDSLNHLAIEYRWCVRFIPLDKHQAKVEIERTRKKWFAKRKNMLQLIKEMITKEESPLSDSDALAKTEDADSAINELGLDEINYGYFTLSIILFHDDPHSLALSSREVERVLNFQGFVTRVETINALEAWLGTIPGNARHNVRRPLLSTCNLSHLIPGGNAVWAGPLKNGHLEGPPLIFAKTSGATPFRLVTHVGDVGHTLILGPTGAGKSTALCFIELQFLRYPNAQVYIFDKGASARAVTAGVGGEYYDLGSETSQVYLQPLRHIDDISELRWAHEWLLDLLQRDGINPEPQIKRIVWTALESLAATPKEERTLSALMVFTQNNNIRKALQHYTSLGPHGRILDNSEETITSSATWQCFEMESLMETPSIVLPVLSYLFHRLSKRFDGKPTLLVLDEAWLFLDHPSFAAKIREWLKTLRKVNVSVIFATQSLADIDESSIASTVKEACFTKIYLPNAAASTEHASQFYRRFGLNERQIAVLSQLTPKRDYYYTSPLGSRVFDLALDDLALAYCSGASIETRNLIKELQGVTRNLPEFNEQFLLRKGFVDMAAKIATLYKGRIAA